MHKILSWLYISKSGVALGRYALFDNGATGVPEAELSFRDKSDWHIGTPLPIPQSDRTTRQREYDDDLGAILAGLSEVKEILPAMLLPCP